MDFSWCFVHQIMVFARFCKNVIKTSSRSYTRANYQKCVSCGTFIDFQHVWKELLSFLLLDRFSHIWSPVIQQNSFFNSPLQVVQRRLFLASFPSSFHRLWPELCLYMKALIWFRKRWSTRRSNFPRVRKLEKNKMEATNPNVFTFLDYECKPLQ